MAIRTRIKSVSTDQPDPGYPQTIAEKWDVSADIGAVYGPVNIPVDAKHARLEVVSQGPNTILDEPPTSLIFYCIDIDSTGAGDWQRRTMAETGGSDGIPPRFPHLIAVKIEPEDAGKPIRAVVSNNARIRFGIDAAFLDANEELMDVF